ncbi:MAG: hypothetical protein UZ22_OP11002000776 [Microgenomates bacterium OLB23]|nr:MAG: hypothetical protein UZ22_OP11002000776 [Microgenomates bacterium OLB23]
MAPTPFINPDNFAPARFGTINTMLGLVVPFLFVVISLIALGVLFKGAFMFITAGGDSHKLEAGRKTFLYASVGIVIIFTSFFVVRIIATIFEVPFLL